MGMSYKRAWLLVETMNRCFSEPLVRTSRGGSARGGAALTSAGAQVLALYRRMEERASQAVEPELAGLQALCRDRAARE
jgi:molybdate transport system regulatory protein